MAHIDAFISVLKSLESDRAFNGDPSQRILREPLGVCGLITPWNWPMSQIVLKVVPALAVGCTVVLKPSEIAPISAMIFAEIVDEAGYAPGVFNLVNGEGPTVGDAIARSRDIDMLSLTGSARAGIAVTKAAADSIKRVTLELGGKSPNIIFEDADVVAAVTRGVLHCFENTGQSCDAPTRMLVQRSIYDQAVEVAIAVGAAVQVDDPRRPGDHIGPLASDIQFDKVQQSIRVAMQEGAKAVLGGPGRPAGFDRGYFVRPTIFADVGNDVAIAREEIFGPVLSIIPFGSEEEAVQIANDTPYGLSAYVNSEDAERANRVARLLRAGVVHINGAPQAPGSPFGGYNQSGNGREGGTFGLEDFLEVKSVSGYRPPSGRA